MSSTAAVFQEVSEKLEHNDYTLEIVEDPGATRLGVIDYYGCHKYEASIDHIQLMEATDSTSMVKNLAGVLLYRMQEELACSGDYPVIRLWAERKSGWNGCSQHKKQIPGWVFAKWAKMHPGQKADKHSMRTTVIPESQSFPQPVPPAPFRLDVGDVAKKRIITPEYKNRVTKKKPCCKIHSDKEMEFNAIRQVWECKEVGCGLIARPKRNAEEDGVVLGKGNVSLRVVFKNGVVSGVVLISDDNVALDVSDLISGGRENIDVSNNADGTQIARITLVSPFTNVEG